MDKLHTLLLVEKTGTQSDADVMRTVAKVHIKQLRCVLGYHIIRASEVITVILRVAQVLGDTFSSLPAAPRNAPPGTPASFRSASRHGPRQDADGKAQLTYLLIRWQIHSPRHTHRNRRASDIVYAAMHSPVLGGPSSVSDESNHIHRPVSDKWTQDCFLRRVCLGCHPCFAVPSLGLGAAAIGLWCSCDGVETGVMKGGCVVMAQWRYLGL